MFGKAEAEVSKSERAGAKMINFGIADEMIVECSRELTEDVRALTVEKMQTAPFGAKKMGQTEWGVRPQSVLRNQKTLADRSPQHWKAKAGNIHSRREERKRGVRRACDMALLCALPRSCAI